MYNSIYPFHTSVQIVLGSPRVWDYSRFISDITAVFRYMNVCHLAEEFSLLGQDQLLRFGRRHILYTTYSISFQQLVLPEYKTVSLITLGVWFSIIRFINGIMVQSIWNTVGSQALVNLNFIPPGLFPVRALLLGMT